MEYRSAIKKNEVLIHAASYTHAKRKKPDTKDHIFYDSLDMKCPGQANPK